MDVNYFYQRQQISQFNADHAGCERSRSAHQGMADAYALIVTGPNVAVAEMRP